MTGNESSGNRETLTVAEVQKLLGIGKNASYKLVLQHNLAIRNGSRLLIPRIRLKKFLEGQ